MMNLKETLSQMLATAPREVHERFDEFLQLDADEQLALVFYSLNALTGNQVGMAQAMAEMVGNKANGEAIPAPARN